LLLMMSWLASGVLLALGQCSGQEWKDSGHAV